MIEDDEWWLRSQVVPDLRPVFLSATGMGDAFAIKGGTIHIRFPWWDHQAAASKLIGWFRAARAGDRFSDMDQGWRFDAVLIGELFHFRDSDFDTEEVFANVAVERTKFLDALATAERATKV